FINIEAPPQRRRVRRRLPAARVVDDELADATLCVRPGMPEPGPDETAARLQVDVERWRRDFTAPFVEQARTLPALVGRLVAGEAGVTLDAKQRTAHALGFGAEMRADLRQGWLQVGEQALERLA